MTMPHLSNCPHDGNGWCLNCVNKLWKEKETKEAEIEALKANVRR
jgi:hypothetical protein